MLHLLSTCQPKSLAFYFECTSNLLFLLEDSCRVAVEDVGSLFALDPCNCSTYYERVLHPVPGRERKLCASGLLWNHKLNQCKPSSSVLDNRLCDRGAPWDRCLELTGKICLGKKLPKCSADVVMESSCFICHLNYVCLKK